MANVVLKQIVKNFGKIEVLHDIDLNLESGKFIVLVGPSGCGKSTLLRLIAGLDECSSGDIFIDNICVTKLPSSERNIAMVFQEYALYPHMSVWENITFGLRMAGKDKSLIKKRANYAASTLQLENLLQRKPKQLSGGQRQRVAIGRAIVRKPKVFLFDEPLSNLDTELRMEMRIEIAKLHQKLDSTMIYVTHDQVEAMTMADQIVVMNNGYVEQTGSPLTLYYQPVNMFVAGFLGAPKMNFITCVAADVNDTEVQISLDDKILTLSIVPGSLKKGQKMYLGIRPEHIVYDKPCPLKITMSVSVVEHLGNISYAHGTLLNNNEFIAEIPVSKLVTQGSRINIGIDVKRCYLFDKDGMAIKSLNHNDT